MYDVHSMLHRRIAGQRWLVQDTCRVGGRSCLMGSSETRHPGSKPSFAGARPRTDRRLWSPQPTGLPAGRASTASDVSTPSAAGTRCPAAGRLAGAAGSHQGAGERCATPPASLLQGSRLVGIRASRAAPLLSLCSTVMHYVQGTCRVVVGCSSLHAGLTSWRRPFCLLGSALSLAMHAVLQLRRGVHDLGCAATLPCPKLPHHWQALLRWHQAAAQQAVRHGPRTNAEPLDPELHRRAQRLSPALLPQTPDDSGLPLRPGCHCRG